MGSTQQPLQVSDVQTFKDNVQGDVLGDGFLKQVELFWFFKFQEDQAGNFRKKLPQLIPLIATVGRQQDERARVAREVDKIKNAASDAMTQDARDISVPSKQANIAFTSVGLEKLKNAGNNFDINLSPGVDPKQDFFQQGMEAGAVELLNDPPSSLGGNKPNWDEKFIGRQIHGVLLIAANDNDQAGQMLKQILAVLGSTVSEVKSVSGSARPGQLRRHEHFGYLDGISEPGVLGFDSAAKTGDDKELVAPGVFLCNYDQDPVQGRPSWTKDGTFLVFRWLEQKVPEFNRDLGEKFAKQLNLKNTPANCDAIGARIIGRWKSGAIVIGNDSDPMPLSTQKGMTKQDIDKATKINDRVNFGGFLETSKCPLGSHIRKMNPRDLGGFEAFRIIRRGIQFGPEVSAAENDKKATDPKNQRGLLFACYQSSIKDGFAFIQQTWANKEEFPGKGAGVDPMVGQQNIPQKEYQMLGMNKANPTAAITIPYVNPYVVPLGGEYFFVPSISALNTVLADTTASGSTVPPPIQSGPPIPCYVNNRISGTQPTAQLPIDGQSHRLSELWGNGITGNWMGAGGFVPNNIVIQVSGNGKTFTLQGDQTPVQVSTSGPIDLSQFTILGRKTN